MPPPAEKLLQGTALPAGVLQDGAAEPNAEAGLLGLGVPDSPESRPVRGPLNCRTGRFGGGGSKEGSGSLTMRTSCKPALGSSLSPASLPPEGGPGLGAVAGASADGEGEAGGAGSGSALVGPARDAGSTEVSSDCVEFAIVGASECAERAESRPPRAKGSPLSQALEVWLPGVRGGAHQTMALTRPALAVVPLGAPSSEGPQLAPATSGLGTTTSSTIGGTARSLGGGLTVREAGCLPPPAAWSSALARSRGVPECHATPPPQGLPVLGDGTGRELCLTGTTQLPEALAKMGRGQKD